MAQEGSPYHDETMPEWQSQEETNPLVKIMATVLLKFVVLQIGFGTYFWIGYNNHCS